MSRGLGDVYKRQALCIGVKNAIFNVLTMFKINVPEKM